MTDRPATKPTEIEITPEMIEAGEEAVLCEVGGADLGGFFLAGDLAARVYRAMRAAALRDDDNHTDDVKKRATEWLRNYVATRYSA